MQGYLWRVAVGNTIAEYQADTPVTEVWQFLKDHLENRDDEVAVVFQDDGANEHGKILNAAAFYALFETPQDVKKYINHYVIDNS